MSAVGEKALPTLWPVIGGGHERLGLEPCQRACSCPALSLSGSAPCSSPCHPCHACHASAGSVLRDCRDLEVPEEKEAAPERPSQLSVGKVAVPGVRPGNVSLCRKWLEEEF